MECVVGAQSDSYVGLLENVRIKIGLSAEVREEGPFMFGFFWFLAGVAVGCLGVGCVSVCVYRELIVPHDTVDGVQFFFKFVVLQAVGVQPIV